MEIKNHLQLGEQLLGTEQLSATARGMFYPASKRGFG